MSHYCPNVSTTPITAMGYRQCLPLSVVELKGKHCQKPHCRNGVADTFGPNPLNMRVVLDINLTSNNGSLITCFVRVNLLPSDKEKRQKNPTKTENTWC